MAYQSRQLLGCGCRGWQKPAFKAGFPLDDGRIKGAESEHHADTVAREAVMILQTTGKVGSYDNLLDQLKGATDGLQLFLSGTEPEFKETPIRQFRRRRQP